jgi:hypothetical protein
MEQQPEYTKTIAGGLLVITSLVAFAFILHHPTLGTPGYASIAEEAMAEAPLNRAVHGAMILVMITYYFALSIVSDFLGRQYILVRLAQLAFTIATISLTGAALLSGFVTTNLAAAYVDRPEQAELFMAQLRLAFAGNQALDLLGVSAFALAIIFWSIRLLKEKSMNRICGILGCVIGSALLIGMATSHLQFDVHGMIMLVAGFAIWAIFLGIQLLRKAL